MIDQLIEVIYTYLNKLMVQARFLSMLKADRKNNILRTWRSQLLLIFL